MTVDSGPLMMILRLSPDLVAFLSFYVASFSCRFSSHEYLAATGPHPPRKTTEGGQKTHPGCLGQRPAQGDCANHPLGHAANCQPSTEGWAPPVPSDRAWGEGSSPRGSRVLLSKTTDVGQLKFTDTHMIAQCEFTFWKNWRLKRYTHMAR